VEQPHRKLSRRARAGARGALVGQTFCRRKKFPLQNRELRPLFIHHNELLVSLIHPLPALYYMMNTSVAPIINSMLIDAQAKRDY
jgi:hypothetical protein